MIAFVASLALLGCQAETPPVPAGPKANLSEYGFFKGPLANLAPADGVIPYDIQTPLFSDYTKKRRFLKSRSASKRRCPRTAKLLAAVWSSCIPTRKTSWL